MGIDDPPAAVLAQIDNLVRHLPPIPKGAFLYQAGQACRGIHIVRTGVVRKFSLTPDGTERVLGFYIGADMLGLEALEQGYHRFSAQALDTTSSCLLPAEDLEDLACQLPSIFHQVVRLLAYAEFQEKRGILALHDLPADVRVAAFLLRLAQRFHSRGINSNELPLKVPRGDVANYLGLNRATVSRTISRLERAGLIHRPATWGVIRILDREGLAAKAQGYEGFF
jgi:CRP/FNR family transcriptional regulator